jgi:sugar lactone lactonase YvrE
MILNKSLKFILSLFLCVAILQVADGQEKSYLYYTDAVYQRILRVDQNGGDFEEIITDGLGFPWRIAIDEKAGKIYWTNVDYNLVQRANMDGSEVENLLVVTYPQGIAVDTERGKIYITEAGTPQILVANLDGSGLDTLITNGLSDPDDIVLDHEREILYWVDTSLKRIMKACTHRSQAVVLIDSLYTSDPTALAVDSKNLKIYWADTGSKQILRAELDGTHAEPVITGLNHPDGLAVDPQNGWIYWSDKKLQKIFRADFDGTHIIEIVAEEITDFHLGIALWKTGTW